MRSFYIEHNKDGLHLNTAYSKYQSLERILVLLSKDYLENNKHDDLKSIITRIQVMLEAHEEILEATSEG